MKAPINMDYMWNYTPNGVVVVVVQIETAATWIADFEEIICVLLSFIWISKIALSTKKKKHKSIFVKIALIRHNDFDLNFYECLSCMKIIKFLKK
jgi:hypothetical protein